MVYSHNIDRNIAGSQRRIEAWTTLDLTDDQKLYRIVFSSSVLPQLLLRTKKQKQLADQTAINTLRRMTRRKGKIAEQEEEQEEDKEKQEDNS